jgi:hypothetical protein
LTADGADDEPAPGVDADSALDGALDLAAALDGGMVAPVAVATSRSSMLSDDGVPGGIGSM